MKTEVEIGVVILIAMIAIVGFIFVLPSAITIARAQDVEFVGLSDGQVLTYNSTSGNWTNQYVNGTVSSMSLENLTDVLLTGLANNQTIMYNDTSDFWINTDLIAGPQGIQGVAGVNGTDGAEGPQGIQGPAGTTLLSGCTDVTMVGLSDGQILRYNATLGKWASMPNNVQVGNDAPTVTYPGLLWYNTTSSLMMIRSGDDLSWLNLAVYNSGLWNGNAFGDYLDQAVKVGSSPTFVSLTLSQITGTSPFTISSTTLVNNLNVDFLDSQHGSFYQNASNINTGSLSLSYIPIMDDSHIPNLETLSYGNTFAIAQIPNLDAGNITSGTFGTSRLDLSALAQNIAFTSTQTVDGVDISALLLKTTKVTDLGNIWDKTTKIAFADTSITKSDLGLGNVEDTALSNWAGTSNIITVGTITTGTWSGTVITGSKLDLSALAQNIAFTSTQTVDGVDISALLLKTTKTTDLGNIWDKTTKIVYSDTSFSDQNLLTTSSPTFGILNLNGEIMIFGASGQNREIIFINPTDPFNAFDLYNFRSIWGKNTYDIIFSTANAAGNSFVERMKITGHTEQGSGSIVSYEPLTVPSLVTPGTVDGIDISAVLDQAVKTTSYPIFGGQIILKEYGGSGDLVYLDAGMNGDSGNVKLRLRTLNSGGLVDAATLDNLGSLTIKNNLYLSNSDAAVYSGLSAYPAFGISHVGNTTYGGMMFTVDDWDSNPQWSWVGSRSGIVMMKLSSEGNLVVYNTIQAGGYKSSDGSTGYTGTLGGIVFKNGLAMAP